MKRLLAATLLCSAATNVAAEMPTYDMISLQAEARAEVPNDLLTATLFVEITSTDTTKLAADVNRTLNQGVRLVHEFPGVKIETGQQSTWPVYDAKNRLTGWRTHAELRVESKDFDAAAKAIAKLQGNMQLANVSFVLSPDTADSTENRLIETALKAFRTRADIAMKTLGAKSWRTVNLNINTAGQQPPMPYVRAMAMKAEADIPAQEVAGGDSQLTVNVNGTIQLQP